VSSPRVLEGDDRNVVHYAVFEIQLSVPSPVAQTFNVQTIDGTAKQGVDYVANKSTLTFQPGELIRFVPVAIIGNTIPQPNRFFYLKLDNSTPTLKATRVGWGTALIIDDDPRPPFLHVSNPRVFEGDTAPTSTDVAPQYAPIVYSRGVRRPFWYGGHLFVG
jgi:hypothetical protein